MKAKLGMTTYWLVIMITLLKIFSIIFLCSLSIDLEKLFMSKYKRHVRINPVSLENTIEHVN